MANCLIISEVMSMNNKKRIGIVALIMAVLTGGYFGIKQVQQMNRKAKVVQVAMMNNQYYDEGTQSYGNVWSADTQNIYLQPSQIVSAVHVGQGQQVAKGDPLISFDMTSQQLSYEIQQLQVESLKNDLAKARQELVFLKNPQEKPLRLERQFTDFV